MESSIQTGRTSRNNKNFTARRTPRAAAAAAARHPRNSRLDASCLFESLESRQLLSTAVHNTHAAELAIPSTLNAAAKGPTSVGLTWVGKDTTAAGYYILRSSDGANFSQVGKVTNYKTASFTDTSAAPHTHYTYEIQAYNTGALSGMSTPAQVTTSLSAPTSLSAAAQSGTSINLSWIDNDSTALGYRILRGTDGKTFSLLETVSGPTLNTYTDSHDVSGHKYFFEVQAIAGDSTSSVSNIAYATTPLAAPSRLEAAALTSNSVKLTWADNDLSATGYYILRSTDGAHFSQIGKTTSGTETGYTDKGLSPQHKYYYEIQAFDSVISSPVSNIASASTPLAIPTSVTASAKGPNSVLVSWSNTDPSATGYYILRAGDGQDFTPVAKLTSGTTLSWTDSNVSSNSHYRYEVQAYSLVNTSSTSNIATVTTPLMMPTGLTATAPTTTSVQLNWTDNDSAATGYLVFRITSDGTTYAQIANLTGGSVNSYTDLLVGAGHAYKYKVEAISLTNSSAITSPVSVATAMMAPSDLHAAASGAAIQLNWLDHDSTATGYYVMRSTDGTNFTQVAKLTSGAATGFTDSTVTSAHGYCYEVEAFNSVSNSPMSNMATVMSALAAPTSLTATLNGAYVNLSWTNKEPAATGFLVLRNDGSGFTTLTTINSGSTTVFTDTTVNSAHTYYYEVEAVTDTMTSAPSNAAAATIAMQAPTSLTATLDSSTVKLAWTNKEPAATGFILLRSVDGGAYSTLTTITSSATTTFTDSSVTTGHTYNYQVKATMGSTSSALSNTASITIAAPPAPAPVVPDGTGVTISTRFGNELVITAGGTQDSILVSQSGSTLSITADGTVYTQSIPAAGLFIYARGGSDSISLDGTLTTRTTVESIDGATTSINSSASNVSAWIDSTDAFQGSGVVHSVASFAGGVSKALGAALPNPTDSGTTIKVNHSLFGTAPIADDINQGSVGDCYFLSTLAAFAGTKPSVLTEAAVDMGDGTYVVRYVNSSNATSFVRVTNDFPAGYFPGGLAYEHPGTTGDIWGLVMEKAYAYFRTGANTYSSLNSGWMGTVDMQLGVSSNTFFMSSETGSAFYNMVSTSLASGKPITLGTYNPQTLVNNHAYTLVSVSVDGNGVAHYVVRNPWGVSGDSLENSQGYATLTFAQMQANFYDGANATS
jgi:fibronectin type 3 domain-containing protein